MHRATSSFWDYFESLPPSIQKIAKNTFKRLKNDPWHPALHFKKVGKFWSVRIGLAHRALAIEDGDDFIWVWIGTHDEYERLIK